jgi:hypothetical protein
MEEGASSMDEQEREAQQHALHARRVEVTNLIADQLGETQKEPRALLYRVVKKIGPETALAFLQKTHEVEEAGGLLRYDGSRRTPGGTFFHLVTTDEGLRERVERLFPISKKKERQGEQAQRRVPPPPIITGPPLSWADRVAALSEIGTAEKGTINTVKITVIGRPGKVIERATCVLMSMKTSKVPSLPKGLPAPDIAATTYTVYIANKQWRKVAAALEDPDDILIIEGYPQLDLKTNSIAVFATNTTTKMLQMATKQAQQQKAQEV